MSVPSGVKTWGFWVTLLALRLSAWGQDPSVVGQWSAVKNWPISATHAHLLPTGEVMFSGEFDTGTDGLPLEPDDRRGQRAPAARLQHLLRRPLRSSRTGGC